MRHRKHSNSLGLTKEHRLALMANMSASLIEHGRIKTTLKKAKALRPFVEKIITLSKKGTLHDRRIAIARVRDVDAVHTLFEEKAEQFANRNGGYTRIYKLGTRQGDAAEMALIELIDADDEGYAKKSKAKAKKAAPKKAAKKAAKKAVKKEEKPEVKAVEEAPVAEDVPSTEEANTEEAK